MTDEEQPYGGQPPPYGAPPPPYGAAPQPYGAPPQPYGQPPYGAPPPYGQPPYVQARGTNPFAIASLICSFLCSPLGLIFGLIAHSQIKKNGQAGAGLATAGIMASIGFFVLGIVLVATGHAAFQFGG